MTLHVLTGASRGLGAAMLHRLLRDGHHVVAAARGPAPEMPGHSGRLDWTRLDLGDLAAAQDWVIRTLAGCEPQPAVLILNAGFLDPLGPVTGLRPDAVEAHMRVNLASPMLVTAGFLEATRDWPVSRRILAISSGAGRRGVSHWSAYCSSKAGLDNFIRSLNAEYAGQPGPTVRAVSLAPGVVDTAMQHTIRGLDAPDQERFRTLHAEGRLASPNDAAAAILAYLERDDFGTNEIDDVRNY